jgi:hypothetical protein
VRSPPAGISADEIEDGIHDRLRLPGKPADERRHLWRSSNWSVARKVVGVGSVGTGRTSCCCKAVINKTPVPQVKEATTSV